MVLTLLLNSSRTKADRARQVLGWRPEYGEDSFLEEIQEVVSGMINDQDS